MIAIKIFGLAAALLWTGSALAGDIKPADPKTPVLAVYAPTPTKSGASYDEAHPLLKVYSVKELILGRDNKGVLLGLNAKDTKVLAALTHQHDGGLLILRASDTAMEVMHITAPIEDGYLGFKYPDSAAVAECLRRRFQVAEFK